MTELKLEVGEYYADREGMIRGPISINPDYPEDSAYEFDDGCFELYRLNGRYFDQEYRESTLDLVEHIPRADPRHPNFVPASQLTSLKRHPTAVATERRQRCGNPYFLNAELRLLAEEQRSKEQQVEAAIDPHNYIEEVQGWTGPWGEAVTDPDHGYPNANHRLLKKTELIKSGDEFFCEDSKRWCLSKNWNTTSQQQTGGLMYRRRVEQPSEISCPDCGGGECICRWHPTEQEWLHGKPSPVNEYADLVTQVDVTAMT